MIDWLLAVRLADGMPRLRVAGAPVAEQARIEVQEMRTGKALIDATRPFAVEHKWRSLWELKVTFACLGAALVVASGWLTPWLSVRVLGGIVAGLFTVRGFILYHDALHGAIFRGPSWLSRSCRGFLRGFGVLVLTPPNTWRQTHNYHHAHTAKIVGSHVGSFPVLTVAMYKSATPTQRMLYRIARHPITMLVGYATIFIFGMCIHPFLRNPRKNWDSALSLILHIALTIVVIRLAGVEMYVLTMLLPLTVAFAFGSYLFYAQHNFPEIEIQPRETWEYTRAALESSSYLHQGAMVSWLTGNIGYHHVHHLNASIPFYRLPEVMHAIPELQHPHETTLWPRDVVACLNLKLWDPTAHKMVGYPRAGA